MKLILVLAVIGIILCIVGASAYNAYQIYKQRKAFKDRKDAQLDRDIAALDHQIGVVHARMAEAKALLQPPSSMAQLAKEVRREAILKERADAAIAAKHPASVLPTGHADRVGSTKQDIRGYSGRTQRNLAHQSTGLVLLDTYSYSPSSCSSSSSSSSDSSSGGCD